MKIAAITFFPHRLKRKHRWQTASYSADAVQVFYVKLQGESGLTGFGAASLMPNDDIVGIAQVNKSVTPFVLADQSVNTPEDVAKIAESKAAKGVSIKLLKLGGIRKSRAVVKACESMGLVCQWAARGRAIGRSRSGSFYQRHAGHHRACVDRRVRRARGRPC